MVVVAFEVAERCQQPQCEECKVMVEQEKTDLVVVDWSQAWWDLDLTCLDTLTVRLNGESVSQSEMFYMMSWLAGWGLWVVP